MLRQFVTISTNPEILSAKHCWLQCPIYCPNQLLEFLPLLGLEVKEKGRVEVLFYSSTRVIFLCNYMSKHFLSFHGKYRMLLWIHCSVNLKGKVNTRVREKVRTGPGKGSSVYLPVPIVKANSLSRSMRGLESRVKDLFQSPTGLLLHLPFSLLQASEEAQGPE